MANKVKLKRSYTVGSVPLTTDLDTNEVAVNWADNKLFTKNAAGDIVSVTLGGSGGGGTVTIPAYDPFFSQVSLLLHMNGASGATTFTDSSASTVTVTRYGNAQVGSTSKFGSGAALFDGTGDYLSLPTGAHTNFGTNDFCVECWVRPAALAATQALFASQDNSADSAPIFRMLLLTSGLLYFTVRGGSLTTAVDITSSASISVNQWSHIALSRASGVFRMYVNGTLSASNTPSPAATLNLTLPMFIGSGNVSGTSTWELNGLIDEFRITNGTARGYAGSTITVPTAAFPDAAEQTLAVTGSGSGGSGLTWSSVPASATATGTAGQIAYDASYQYICVATNTWVRATLEGWLSDSYYSSVSLLLSMNGLATSFVDSSSSPKTITAYFGATQSGAAYKFGGRSLFLSGTTFGAGPYLSVPYSSALNLSTGDWTVECWSYATVLNANNNLFAINNVGDGYAQVLVNPQSDGSAYFLLQGSDNSWLSVTTAPSGTFKPNVWQHVAAVRSGNTFRLYVDGTSVVTFTSSSALANASGISTIGYRMGTGNSSVGSHTWQGYIDEFRVTKGVARYSGSSLAVPTLGFSTS